MKRTKKKKEYIVELRKEGYKWITRAKHGEVQAHKTKPIRMLNYWESKGRIEIKNDIFTDVRWEDEPLCIGKELKRSGY